jgi:riboflavin synthase
MFTGIIEAIGTIKRIEPVGGDVRLLVEAGALDMEDVKIGDSIAINGVCLTVVKHYKSSFDADVSNETISLTTMKNLKEGSRVNLEKALLPTTRLGGHLVSGHVDGVGHVSNISRDARSTKYTIDVPDDLKRYIAVKGSICVDGVSLTVNHVTGNSFEVNIIPHTQEQTIIQTYKTGDKVNIEVDLVARYLERLLLSRTGDILGDTSGDASKITVDMLSKAGFVGQ